MGLNDLMSKTLYLGVRVEIASRFYTMRSLAALYNRRHDETKVLDVCKNGRITIHKNNGMLIAHGEKNEKGDNGLVNFAVVSVIDGQKERDVKRIVQIVNVLGNDRLIRERVKTFVDGKSMLSKIPEMQCLSSAFKDIEKLMPGIISSGWYYAPEALMED